MLEGDEVATVVTGAGVVGALEGGGVVGGVVEGGKELVDIVVDGATVVAGTVVVGAVVVGVVVGGVDSVVGGHVDSSGGFVGRGRGGGV